MKILVTPDPFLRKTAHPVTSLTPKTLKEIQEMITVLKAAKNPEGVGLAATQVGLDKRIFVLLLPQGPHVFINPAIVRQSKKMLSDVHKRASRRWLEGCLSIPRLWGFVDRPYQVNLKYQTPDGEFHQHTFKDTQAAYIQHEIDHLNGLLFTDRILQQKGVIYQETPSGLTPLCTV